MTREVVPKHDPNKGLFSKHLVFYLYFSYAYWYLFIGYLLVNNTSSRVG